MKKILQSLLGIAIASLLTLIVYFFSSIFFRAAANDLSSENAVDVILFVIMLFCAVMFCGILLWVRHIHNDESENDFMKECREAPYRGMRHDIPRAMTFDLPTYFIAFLIMGLSMIFLLAGIPLTVLAFFMPLTGMMSLFHPLVGFLIHLALFTVLYTFGLCLLRKRWATQTTSRRVISGNSVNAERWSARNRHRWH
ncbi:MAG: hypothetical protein ACI4V1_09010 [Eubacteriales bacterium]